MATKCVSLMVIEDFNTILRLVYIYRRLNLFMDDVFKLTERYFICSLQAFDLEAYTPTDPKIPNQDHFFLIFGIFLLSLSSRRKLFLIVLKGYSL